LHHIEACRHGFKETSCHHPFGASKLLYEYAYTYMYICMQSLYQGFTVAQGLAHELYPLVVSAWFCSFRKRCYMLVCTFHPCWILSYVTSFFQILFADGGSRLSRHIYYRIVHLFDFKYFLWLLQSKGNAGLFSNLVCQTDMREADGRGQGQPSQTEIYYRIVHFYCFKYFLLALEKQRQRLPFFKLCLADGYARNGRAARASLARRKYIIGLFNFTVSNTFC